MTDLVDQAAFAAAAETWEPIEIEVPCARAVFEVCIKNDEFCIKNGEFCIENDEL